MKKIVKLLLLFVMPLLFVACSDDEYKDLQIPDKSYTGEVQISGYVYYHETDATWYFSPNDEDWSKYFHFYFEEGASIQINDYSPNVPLEEIEGVEKTFIGRLILYDYESSALGATYYYIFNISRVQNE